MDAPIIRYGDPVIVHSEDCANAYYVYVVGPEAHSSAGPCDLATARKIAADVQAELKSHEH